jgi:hypothetical protein
MRKMNDTTDMIVIARTKYLLYLFFKSGIYTIVSRFEILWFTISAHLAMLKVNAMLSSR